VRLGAGQCVAVRRVHTNRHDGTIVEGDFGGAALLTIQRGPLVSGQGLKVEVHCPGSRAPTDPALPAAVADLPPSKLEENGGVDTGVMGNTCSISGSAPIVEPGQTSALQVEDVEDSASEGLNHVDLASKEGAELLLRYCSTVALGANCEWLEWLEWASLGSENVDGTEASDGWSVDAVGIPAAAIELGHAQPGVVGVAATTRWRLATASATIRQYSFVAPESLKSLGSV
jgi:hypothetical protein